MHRIAVGIITIASIVFLCGCSKEKPGAPAGPILSLSTNSLEFSASAGGSNPPEQRVVVRNGATGDMTYQATSLADWISIAASHGLNPDTINVAVSTAQAPAAVSVDSILVTSPEAVASSPQYVRVTFNVIPTITVDPDALIFSAYSGSEAPDTQYFDIFNSGAGEMDFSVSKDSSWLTLIDPAGTTPDSVGVIVDPTGLVSGVYTDSIVVFSQGSNNQSLKFPVTLTVSSWTLSNEGISVVHDLQALTFVGGIGWTAGFIGNNPEHVGVIFKTTDSGQSWENSLIESGTALGGITFSDPNAGCVVGTNAVIMLTSDGGETWVRNWNLPVGDSVDFWTVKFVGPDTGWTTGAKGIIMRTVDGGQNWEVQNSSTLLSLSTMAFKDSQTGWIVGNNGNILRTTDGGDNWVIQNGHVSADLWAIAFNTDNSGFIMGNNGVVLHTTDGGDSWGLIDVGTTMKLQDLFFVSETHGWAVGLAGTIIHTEDGGVTWLPQFVETEDWLFGVYFFNDDLGLTVGQNGTILRTTRGGF